MASLVEEEARATVLHSVKGIQRAFLVKDNDDRLVLIQRLLVAYASKKTLYVMKLMLAE